MRKHNSIVGFIISFEETSEIQENEYELRRQMRKSEHNASYSFEDIIYKSNVMETNILLAKKLAKSDSTIMIQGESGTGKEFLAQAIHNHSPRSKEPFVPVNFAALSGNLLESELFGYEEGAFTGASKGGKAGLFELAHGGTIFLDEIGDAPLEFQSRLLRVLQEKQIRRVGGSKLIPINVRTITATNKSLRDEVAKGNFREDLYYRLNVLPLNSPNLKSREEDILLLIEYYLCKFLSLNGCALETCFTEEALSYLRHYPWPGNVRELVNVVEYLVNIRSEDKKIDICD